MLKAILFDLDGTLLFTAEANAAAYAEALAEHGVSVDAARISPMIDGRSWRDFLPRLIGDAPVAPEVVACRKRALYPRHFGLVRPNSPVVGLLHVLRGRLATGLVTTASASAIQGLLPAFNLESSFDVVVSGDDVSSAKPHPEGYRLAAARLGALPAQCLVVEDSEIGLAAAHAFGGTVLRVSQP